MRYLTKTNPEDMRQRVKIKDGALYPVILKSGDLMQNTKDFLKSEIDRASNLFGKGLVSENGAQKMKQKIDKDENHAVKSLWPGVLYHGLQVDKNEVDRLSPLVLANSKLNHENFLKNTIEYTFDNNKNL